MIIFVVVWTRDGSTGSIGLSHYSSKQTKTFGTRAKAEEYVTKLIEAGHLIGVTVDPRIDEQVIE